MTLRLEEQTDREVLVAALTEARARTDDLFSVLKPDALTERPIPERHRLVFYLGHLEAFDWNLIARQGYGVNAFDPRLDKLFAFGIDPTDAARQALRVRDRPHGRRPPLGARVRLAGPRRDRGLQRAHAGRGGRVVDGGPEAGCRP